jgi:signal transduction histidine kinase
MKRLDIRLLLAFGVVLTMTLAIMLLALLLVLRARPVNTDSETISLAAVLIETQEGLLPIIPRDLLTTPRDNSSDTRPSIGVFRQLLDEIAEYLTTQAETKSVRIMIVQNLNCIVWDSNGTSTEYLNDTFTREEFLQTNRRLRSIESQIFNGQFTDDEGMEWLYTAQPFQTQLLGNLPRGGQNGQQRLSFCGEQGPLSLVVAEPVPQQTIRSILQDYRGSGLIWALAQAMLIGMFFAFVASILIMRWISRPLREVTQAASELAEGNYATRVPVSGPMEIQVVGTAFNEMAERVELTQQAQHDFLANVSHDLRTPLTSIQGFAQAIYEGVADADASQRAAKIIRGEAGRLTRMVNELLDLAKIQAGRMDMMRQSVELDQILTTISESLSLKASQKNIDLQVQIPNLPRIAGDGDRLAQVFTNLIDNAIKHTPDGGRVWIRAELDNKGGILTRVEDTGEGIPKADLPRIFERFYQVDKSRTKRLGTGLGLAIVQEIVRAHAGYIWAESEYGQGARFNVWLPQPMIDTGKTVVMSKSALAAHMEKMSDEY